MSSSSQNNKDVRPPLAPNSCTSTQISWQSLVKEQITEGKLKVRKCSCYSALELENLNDKIKCICGRFAREHSFMGRVQEVYRDAKKWQPRIACEQDVTVYGQLGKGARFIRCCMESDDTFQILADLIASDVGNKPKLLVSCYGGAEYFRMTDKLEREFLNGIAQVVATRDVWLLTTGLNSGVSKLIGKGVRRYKLLNANPLKTTVIGMSHWGTLSEYTRQMLKSQVPTNYLAAPWQTTPILDKNVTNVIDKYHSHFLLHDDGRLNNYLPDGPRSVFVHNTCHKYDCYPVTIIVEGGLYSLEVIANDLDNNRPVVIIHGSGRLADVLGNLLKNRMNSTSIEREEIKEQLDRYRKLWPQIIDNEEDIIEGIEKVLRQEKRSYLSVFRLEQDTSLTNTIFGAVLQSQTECKNKERLLELAVNWNFLDGAEVIFKSDPSFQDQYPYLFEQALKENRPVFVDYFLRSYHNPLRTTAFIKYKNIERSVAENSLTHWQNTEDKTCVEYALQFIVEVLYKIEDKTLSVKYPCPKSFQNLKRHYSQLIGSYAESFYDEIDVWKGLRQELKIFWRSWKFNKLFACRVAPAPQTIPKRAVRLPVNLILLASYYCHKPYDKQEMLRDLFLWSVYMSYADIAFVLLLQLKSRIGAALIAVGITQRLSLGASNLNVRNTYDEQRIAYEEYAKACIEACYKRNELFACQLLLREIPLFGNITCVQAAIKSRNTSFINTNCFNQVLNRQWYGHLEEISGPSVWDTCKLFLHFMSFGFFAPIYIKYRSEEDVNKLNQNDSIEGISHNELSEKPWEGIDDQSIEKASYWRKLENFHATPIVKVFYQFSIYVWFLLVFSYMMLFHIRAPVDEIHWTEIYVIIAVSAALLEEIRIIGSDYYTRMTERWHKSDSWILSIYVLPYVLFYIGIGLHFASNARPDLLTPARIVLALDLEAWYLFSLRFVSAVKLWGPKLYMIRNMMHDLAPFVYIIFVCITAYGVVSSALTMYSSIEFTAQNMSSAILYVPYWFLYGIVDDEKSKLDDIISSNTSLADEKVEATVTQVLLAFHMLFINILILNLLIAVFNFSINKVHDKNQYFWRYQRYELVREYFQKPMFAYPPLSLLVYIWLVFKLCTGRKVCQVFKRLTTTTFDKKCTEYESEATYQHARDFVENKYRLRNTTDNSSSLAEPQDEMTLQAQVDKLNDKVTSIHDAMGIIQEQTKQMTLNINQLIQTIRPNPQNE